MKKTKSINTITIINIISTILLQGITFLTLPIFTRLLGTSQYGIFSLFSSWVSILTCFMGFSIASSLGTGMYEFKEDYSKFRNSNLLLSTIISVIQVTFIIMFKDFIAKILGLNYWIIIFIAISAFGHYILMYCQSALTYEKRAITNFIISLIYSSLSVILSLILILNFQEDQRFFGRILGVTISYVISSIIIWIILFKEKPTKMIKKYSKFGLAVGFPIIFHSLSLNILIQSDRVMMQAFNISVSNIGIYSTYYSLCTVLTIIASSLNSSWSPFYFDDLNGKKWDKLEKKSKNYIELFTILCIGFLLLSREVSYIIADKTYWSGINVIPLLVISSYFIFMYQFPVNYEFFHKKTKIIALGTILAAIINIILNILLIPKIGMYGAAIATAISYLLLFIVHFLIVRNMKDNPYHLKFKVFVHGIVWLMFGVLSFYFLSQWWYVRWGLGIILGSYEIYKIYKRKSIF